MLSKETANWLQVTFAFRRIDAVTRCKFDGLESSDFRKTIVGRCISSKSYIRSRSRADEEDADEDVEEFALHAQMQRQRHVTESRHGIAVFTHDLTQTTSKYRCLAFRSVVSLPEVTCDSPCLLTNNHWRLPRSKRSAVVSKTFRSPDPRHALQV